MSILIKGMEMPTSCFDCPFMYARRYCRANSKIEFIDPDYSELKGRYDGCPLVPVPPHGRLIDADAYEALIHGLGNREYRRDNGTICDAIKFLHPHYAPTVIPASEEGE